MSERLIIPAYEYGYQKGPLPESKLSKNIKEGNCRLLLQLYFYAKDGRYFREEELLNPNAFKNTGEFIENFDIYDDDLQSGAVIYAERRRLRRSNHACKREIDKCDGIEDYLTYLHSAIYLQSLDELSGMLSDKVDISGIKPDEPVILHATSFEDGVCVWPIKKFMEYYIPVAAKRFVLSSEATT